MGSVTSVEITKRKIKEEIAWAKRDMEWDKKSLEAYNRLWKKHKEAHNNSCPAGCELCASFEKLTEYCNDGISKAKERIRNIIKGNI